MTENNTPLDYANAKHAQEVLDRGLGRVIAAMTEAEISLKTRGIVIDALWGNRPPQDDMRLRPLPEYEVPEDADVVQWVIDSAEEEGVPAQSVIDVVLRVYGGKPDIDLGEDQEEGKDLPWYALHDPEMQPAPHDADGNGYVPPRVESENYFAAETHWLESEQLSASEKVAIIETRMAGTASTTDARKRLAETLARPEVDEKATLEQRMIHGDAEERQAALDHMTERAAGRAEALERSKAAVRHHLVRTANHVEEVLLDFERLDVAVRPNVLRSKIIDTILAQVPR